MVRVHPCGEVRVFEFLATAQFVSVTTHTTRYFTCTALTFLVISGV